MRAFALLSDFSDSKFNKIQEKENLIDKYEDKLGTYLMQLSMHDLTPDQAKQTSKFCIRSVTLSVSATMQ